MTAPAGRVVAFLASKGGSGNSTLCAHLADAYARQGWRVAVLDLDPQGSARTWCSMFPPELRPATYGLDELGLAPEASAEFAYRTLAEALARVRQEVDLVLVDRAPGVTATAHAALACADLATYPVGPSPLEFAALEQALGYFQAAREARARRGYSGPEGLVVPVRVQRTRLSSAARDVLAGLAETYGARLASSALGFRVAYAEAATRGLGVLGMGSAAGPAALEVRALAAELLELLRPREDRPAVPPPPVEQ